MQNVLSRADVDVLQRLLGRKLVRLLRGLDSAGFSAQRMLELLLQMQTPDSLLRNPEHRRQILDLLRPSEATQLCAVLGLAAPDPYEALHAARFGKRQFEALCEFFGLTLDDHSATALSPERKAIEPAYSLFDHQADAARRCAAHLWGARGRALLHMPTGSGKTRTAMTLVCDFLRAHPTKAVVWLAHSDELCEQAAEEFEKAWLCLGDRTTAVHRFWGPRGLDPRTVDGGLVVVGLQKLRAAVRESIPFIGVLGARSGLVVLDEAHQAIAPTYQLLLDALVEPHRGTALLGLTATPGRTWNSPDLDARLAEYFYRTKVRLEVDGYSNPVEYLIQNGYLARPTFNPMRVNSRFAPSDHELSLLSEDLEVPTAILERLAEDEHRSLAIINEAEHLSRRHRRTIVFATTVEHAIVVANVLNARGVQAAAVTGATPMADRQRALELYRSNRPEHRVICNFGVLTAGFDAPMTSAALIARPTMSLVLYSQMVGRAIRGSRAGGNASAEIVTVVDSALPGFGDLSDAFANWEDVWSEP